jgi:hypothetical protein
MGQEFVKPGQGPSWVADMLFNAAAKVFSNSTQVDVTAELPYFMNPVLAACQMVNVAKPGSAPALADAKEDMTLFSPALADKHGEWLAALLLLPTASVAALLQDSCCLCTAQHFLLSAKPPVVSVGLPQVYV